MRIAYSACMRIDHETCYRALAARDLRFDGLFFVGVTTTGIYCRPICPARTPRPDRCRFFPNAALAERNGFRPCLRCRPELAPGHAPVDAVGRTARLAAAIRRFPGLRVPGCVDGFELAVRAILGQRISVASASILAGRLAATFGEPIETPHAILNRLCPRPEELPGIGDWTAHYVAMRALRWPDAFPAADLGLLRAANLTSSTRLTRRAEAWRPWRAYAAMILWQRPDSVPEHPIHE